MKHFVTAVTSQAFSSDIKMSAGVADISLSLGTDSEMSPFPRETFATSAELGF